MPMEAYMALAPFWAQVLPQPPPAAKYTNGEEIRMFDRRAVEVGGGWGAQCSGGPERRAHIRQAVEPNPRRLNLRGSARDRYRSGAVVLKKADSSAFPLLSGLTSDRHHRRSGAGICPVCRRHEPGHTIPIFNYSNAPGRICLPAPANTQQ